MIQDTVLLSSDFEDDPPPPPPRIKMTSRRRLQQLQCSHAVALKNVVYRTGSTTHNHENDNDNDNSNDNDKIRWRTELESKVSFITCTHDGSMIAVATVCGSVCLLRGNDGRVLLSKSITSATSKSQSNSNSTNTRSSSSHGDKDITVVVPKITFVQNATENNHSLVIYNLDNRHDHGQNNKEGEEEVMNVILLTNIHGSDLNSNDSSVVKQSLSKLSLHGIILHHDQRHPHSNSNCMDIMKALFLSSKRDAIRFVVCWNENSEKGSAVSVHDYNVEQKEIQFRKECLLMDDVGDVQDLNIDVVSDRMRCSGQQQNDTEHFYINVIWRRHGQIFLEWYDFSSLQRVGQHCLRETMDDVAMDYTLDAFCALVPWSEHTIAVAVAMTSKRSHATNDNGVQIVNAANAADDDDECDVGSSHIVVLQGIVSSIPKAMILSCDAEITHKKEKSHAQKMITGIHQVYSIKIESGFKILDLADCSIAGCRECAVRYCMVSTGKKGNVVDVKFREFRTGNKNVIAEAKLLLANHLFDKAQELISSSTKEELTTPYGTIHASDIVLARFKYMICKPQILTGEKKDQVKECLRRLSFGAVSGGPSGVKCLIQASKAIYHLETTHDDVSCNHLSGPYIRDYRLTLLAMAMSISNALKGISNKFIKSLKREIVLLEEKAAALKTVESTFELPSAKHKLELTPPLLHIQNHKELYHLLVEKGAFLIAEDVRKSEMGAKFISTMDMAESVTKISSNIDPRKYCSWIKDIVFPMLNIHQSIVVSIAKWACITADEFDQKSSSGIEDSILLLETIGSALKKLIVDNHSSFANRHPIIACDDKPVIDDLRIVDYGNTSQSECSSNFTCLSIDEIRTNFVMKEHVTATSPEKMINTHDKTFISILNKKLRNAKIIKKARSIGLPFDALKLETFDDIDGSNYAAKELVRLYFTNLWSDYLSDHGNERQVVKEFCRFINMPFDHAIHLFAKDLCSSEVVDPSILARANDLVSLCSKPEIKCDITLRFLQQAQLSSTKPASLKLLANEVIHWTTNEELRSKLQEASRLLGIDEILRKYCGDKATEFFRVSDPIHSIRLVDYITTKYACPSVLSDVLYLCNAFTHLSAMDYCSVLLQRTMESLSAPSDVVECIDMLQDIYEENKELGERVAARVCVFCANSMRSDFKLFTCDESRQRHYEVHCVAAIEICRMASIKSPVCNTWKSEISLYAGAKHKTWATLLREFQRLLGLQKEFDICISLFQLRRRHKSDALAVALVKDALKDLEKMTDRVGSSLRIRLNKSKRALSLLFHDVDASVVSSKWCKAVGHVACKLVSINRGEMSMLLLENAGVLDETHNPTAYQAIIMVVLALCSKAANTNNLDVQQESAMRSIILANSLLQEHALVFCPAVLLPYMVFLGNLVDVVTQIILRFDCGVGEQMETFKRKLLYASKERLSLLEKNPDKYHMTTLRRDNASIILHPSWHYGDGLLLPPNDTLLECMTYCKEILSPKLRQNNFVMLGIHNFLEDRGAYYLSLRMLKNASTVTYCYHFNESLLHHQVEVLQGIALKLAERSLGGSGTGNMSGKIDHEMAVALLLTLPIKVAFKAYKRCLPSAISNRDYERVIALANVGSRASVTTCVNESINSCFSKLTWRNQTTFSDQCQQLSKKAFWWHVLQQLGVKFSPSQFDDDECYKGKKVEYINSLIFDVVRLTSQFIQDVMVMHSLINDFCNAFDLDCNLAIEKHIEFLLSMPDKIDNNDMQILAFEIMDVRQNIESCCHGVQKLLHCLPNVKSRSTILRNCLIAMEKIDSFGQDFERYAAVLSIYKEQLQEIVLKNTDMSSRHYAFVRQELELIDRRQDALAIINAVFGDEKVEDRPSVQRCFIPLVDPSKGDKELPTKVIGVLGENVDYEDNSFDPILPLVRCLKSDKGQSTIASLAPICFAIGVPSGYIHVRALILRLKAIKRIGGAPPPFVSDVLPVIKRLKSPKDGAELAEWCASQYGMHSKERLLCLEVGLDLAMKASTQAEQMLLASSQKDNPDLLENEKTSLERVERISSAKSALSDTLTVKSILESSLHGIKDVAVNRITSTLVDKARSHRSQDTEITPEEFVENLFIEGSRACAESCLDVFMPLDTFGFYRIASAVHEACKELEEQYSHIDVSRIAHSLVRRYLLHGDEALVQPNEKHHDNFFKTNASATNELLDLSMEEDATINLVLDLKIAPGKNVWGDDLGSEEPQLKRFKTMATEEEQSSLNSITAREHSEYLSRRVGLRVAFIMSFAHDFYTLLEEDNWNDENTDPNNTIFSKSQLSDPIARKHAVYLLNLVFSKTSKLERNNFDSSTILDESTISNSNQGIHDRENLSTGVRSFKSSNSTRGKFKGDGKALTFAMRHRALRAACVLCPERLLREIIAQERYSEELEQLELSRRLQTTSQDGLLSKFCFGSFVAKEIEAMGLALPHSDLIQLSMMHHPSYARTLWRIHGKSTNLECHGRLMLLVLELSLRENKVLDGDLVHMILEKVHSLNLPRTHLLICECLSQLPDEEQTRILSQDIKIGSLWLQLLHNVTVSILHDTSTLSSVTQSHRDPSSCRQNSLESSILTIQRWVRVLQTFSRNTNCTMSTSNKDTETNFNLFELKPLLFMLSLALETMSECMTDDSHTKCNTLAISPTLKPTDSPIWQLCQCILGKFESSLFECMGTSQRRKSFHCNNTNNLQTILNQLRILHEEEEEKKNQSTLCDCIFKRAGSLFYQKFIKVTNVKRIDSKGEVNLSKKDHQMLNESDCLAHLLLQDKTLHDEMWKMWSSLLSSSSSSSSFT